MYNTNRNIGGPLEYKTMDDKMTILVVFLAALLITVKAQHQTITCALKQDNSFWCADDITDVQQWTLFPGKLQHFSLQSTKLIGIDINDQIIYSQKIPGFRSALSMS